VRSSSNSSGFGAVGLARISAGIENLPLSCTGALMHSPSSWSASAQLGTEGESRIAPPTLVTCGVGIKDPAERHQRRHPVLKTLQQLSLALDDQALNSLANGHGANVALDLPPPHQVDVAGELQVLALS
jgi:hypothetical protein